MDEHINQTKPNSFMYETALDLSLFKKSRAQTIWWSCLYPDI